MTLLYSHLYTCACICVVCECVCVCAHFCVGAALHCAGWVSCIQQWSQWIIGIMVRLSAVWADPRAATKWERERERDRGTECNLMTEGPSTYIIQEQGGYLFMSPWVGILLWWCVCYCVYVWVSVHVCLWECMLQAHAPLVAAHVHMWECACTCTVWTGMTCKHVWQEKR